MKNINNIKYKNRKNVMNPIDALVQPYIIFNHFMTIKDITKMIFDILIKDALSKVLIFKGQWCIILNEFYNKGTLDLHQRLPIMDSILAKYVINYGVAGLFIEGNSCDIYELKHGTYYEFKYRNYGYSGITFLCSCDHGFVYMGIPGDIDEAVKMLNSHAMYQPKETMCKVCTNATKQGFSVWQSKQIVKFVDDKWIKI